MISFFSVSYLVMEQQLVRQFCSPDADTLMFQVTDEQPIHPSELVRISNANGSI